MTRKEILSANDSQLLGRFFNCLLKGLKEQGIAQQDVAKFLRVSAAHITNLKQGNGTILPRLNKLIDGYEIDFDSFEKSNGTINNLKIGKSVKPSNSIFIPELFKTKKVWLIYSDLVDEIGIRILKVYDDGKVEYIIKSDNHSDYIGVLKAETYKQVLIFELTPKVAKTQDLVIFLWLNNMGATPTIMAGVMIYNRIKDGGGIDAHKILAVPASKGNPIPEKISKDDFKKSHSLISDYFKFERPAKFFSTYSIKDEKTLKEYIEKKADQSTSIKLELLEKIQGINNVNDLEKIREMLQGFKKSK